MSHDMRSGKNYCEALISRSRILAATVAAAALVGATTAVALERALGEAPNLMVVGIALAFGGAGALLSWKRPGLPIGWILGWISLVFMLCAAAGEYARLGLPPRASLPGAVFAAWLQSWLFFLAYPAMFSLLLLWFPNGRAPSRRWARAGIGVAGSGGALLVAAYMFATDPLMGHLSALPDSARNPVLLLTGPASDVLVSLGWAPGTGGLLIAGIALFVRFRRARDLERAQVKVVFGVPCREKEAGNGERGKQKWGTNRPNRCSATYTERQLI